jgi:Transposase
LAHGLLRSSFVPPKPIRRLRDLTRYRKALIGERTRIVNHLRKVLEDAGVKLATVAMDVMGVSRAGDDARADRGPGRWRSPTRSSRSAGSCPLPMSFTETPDRGDCRNTRSSVLADERSANSSGSVTALRSTPYPGRLDEGFIF